MTAVDAHGEAQMLQQTHQFIEGDVLAGSAGQNLQEKLRARSHCESGRYHAREDRLGVRFEVGKNVACCEEVGRAFESVRLSCELSEA